MSRPAAKPLYIEVPIPPQTPSLSGYELLADSGGDARKLVFKKKDTVAVETVLVKRTPKPRAVKADAPWDVTSPAKVDPSAAFSI